MKPLAQIKINISIPNDYNSESATDAAIAEYYGGNEEAASNDNCQQLFEALAAVAKGAGLTFSRSTDFGADWHGTKDQCSKARENLPNWASISDIKDQK